MSRINNTVVNKRGAADPHPHDFPDPDPYPQLKFMDQIQIPVIFKINSQKIYEIPYYFD
jgi:hypothetical protein